MGSWDVRTPAGRRRLAAVVGPALLIAIVGLTTWRNIRLTAEHERWVVHTHQVLLNSADLEKHILEAESGVRGFLLADSASYLEPVAAARAAAMRDLVTLHHLTADNPVQGPRLDSLDRLVATRFTALDRTRATEHSPEVRDGAMHQGTAVMDTITRLTSAINTEEQRLLVRRSADALRQGRFTVLILLAGGAVALVLAALVMILMARSAAEQAAAHEQMASQNVVLENQGLELELQAQQLYEQAAELEATNDELSASNEDLMQANEALTRARADAEAANESKADFLRAMSHDLRTPLNAINGYTDLLETGIRGPMNPAQSEDLRRIRRASTHLLGLINSVLNYAKVDAAQVQYEIETVPVESLLADAAALIEPLALAKRITFERVPCSPPISATSDREKLMQVLLNLLTNAIKFTDTGGWVRMVCDSQPGDRFICIAIEDNGRGIAADQLERIFEPFVQIGRKLYGAEDGAGLGLAISRNLARSLGGDLTVRSVPGEGSTFTLTVVRDVSDLGIHIAR
jgi:signal transduction histidine kinase